MEGIQPGTLPGHRAAQSGLSNRAFPQRPRGQAAGTTLPAAGFHQRLRRLFFVQREVLAWKYFFTSCKHDKGLECQLKQPAQFGTLNAHSRASALVSVQYSGREKVPIRGAEKELIRLDMKTDTGDWVLWLDEQLKLQRILDPANKTEAVRD